MFLCVTIFVLFPHHLTDFFFMRVFMSILVNMSYKGAPKLIVKQAIMAVLSILVFVYLYAPPSLPSPPVVYGMISLQGSKLTGPGVHEVSVRPAEPRQYVNIQFCAGGIIRVIVDDVTVKEIVVVVLHGLVQL